MKHKYYIFIIIAVILIAGIFISTRDTDVTPQETALISPATTTKTAENVIDVKPFINPSSSPVPASLATFKIDEKIYPIGVSPNETVIDAMKALQSAGKITFTGKEYPSLGTFIDSINGIQNANGAYWTLYVNGSESMLGVSSVTVNVNDLIEWRYEKRKY